MLNVQYMVKMHLNHENAFNQNRQYWCDELLPWIWFALYGLEWVIIKLELTLVETEGGNYIVPVLQ
jgi:hypothetical protein